MLKNGKTGNCKGQQKRKTAKNWRFSVQKPNNWPKKRPKPKISTPPSRTWNTEFMTVLYSLTKSTILSRKNETANPYPPKSKMQPSEGQNGQFSHLWFGGRGGLGFPFILFMIVFVIVWVWPRLNWRTVQTYRFSTVLQEVEYYHLRTHSLDYIS